MEIFLFILVAGLLANFIGASVHEGIFVGALVRPSTCKIFSCVACSMHSWCDACRFMVKSCMSALHPCMVCNLNTCVACMLSCYDGLTHSSVQLVLLLCSFCNLDFEVIDAVI